VEDSEKIMLLEDEVVELRFSLKDSKPKRCFILTSLTILIPQYPTYLNRRKKMNVLD
jgi:hypothetical protein